MREELDRKLTAAFPLLYDDRDGDMYSTAMCWGFPEDGWFQLLWDLSSKMEPIIKAFKNQHAGGPCSCCGCPREDHYGYKAARPGKCLLVKSKLVFTTGNFLQRWWQRQGQPLHSCFCNEYRFLHPRATQVKEKYGTLRFYMSFETEEIQRLIATAEALSAQTCEQCGAVGRQRNGGWIKTLCDSCDGGQDAA